MNFIISRNPLFFFLNLLYKKIQTTLLLSTFSRFFFPPFQNEIPSKILFYYFIILSFQIFNRHLEDFPFLPLKKYKSTHCTELLFLVTHFLHLIFHNNSLYLLPVVATQQKLTCFCCQFVNP